MSMLSAQCAELRDKAKLLRGHADGLTAPYVIPSTKELMMLTMLDSAMRMEEAADTIISLRDRLQDIELGRGTCEYVIEDNMNETEGMGDVWFRCTNCGTSYDYYADEWLLKMPYCPKCGCEVER